MPHTQPPSLFTSSHYNSPPQPLPTTIPPHTTSPSSISSGPKKIHRNRASYSCHSCRRRKIKCDRTHPTCSNCLKTGEACKYSDNTGKGGNAGARNSAPGKGSANKSNTSKQNSPDGNSSEIGDGSLSRQSSIRGDKRRRTISSADEYYEDAACEQIISKAEQIRFGSSSVTPTTPTTGEPNLSNSLRSLVKDGELETRVNRLADIVDLWYRDAYVRGLTVRGTGTEDTGSSAPRISQQQPRQSDATQRFQDGSASALPFRGMGDAQKAGTKVAHPQTATATALRDVSSAYWNSEGKKDSSVDDIGIGHLSVAEGGRSRYVGNSYWALLSNEITELNNVLRPSDLPGAKRLEKLAGAISTNGYRSGYGWTSNGLATPSPSSSGVSSIPSPDANGAIARPPTMPVVQKSILLNYETGDAPDQLKLDIQTLLQYLPSPTACEALYEAFLTGVNSIAPLIHIPTFKRQWRSFWAWYPDNTHTNPSPDLVRDPTFVAMVFAVLFSGAMSMPAKRIREHFDGRMKDHVASHLYNATILAIHTNSFPKVPTMNTFTAFLILQTCPIRMEEPLASSQYISLALRVAMSMGFHRDGSLFGLNDIDCEVRRRIWWHLVYLDVQAAMSSGLPPSGGKEEDEFFDTKMVSELKDEYIGMVGGNIDTTDPTNLSIPMILAVGRFEAALDLRRILIRLHGIKIPRKQDISEMSELVADLKARTEKRITRIPARGLPEMGLIPPRGEEPSEAMQEKYHKECILERQDHFNAWARIMLSLLSDRAHGALYEPFLKSTKSTLWQHARKCALRSSQAFLRKFISLSRSTAFQPYQWYYRTYQPLHATMILLLDLYTRPQAPEAAESRMYVDEVFSLFVDYDKNWTGVDGEISPGPVADGAWEAWNMLGRLRQQSYQRAGLQVENVFMEKATAAKDAREATSASSVQNSLSENIHQGANGNGHGAQTPQHLNAQLPQPHEGFMTIPSSAPHDIDTSIGFFGTDTAGIEFSNFAQACPPFHLTSPQYQPEPMMADTGHHGIEINHMSMSGRDEFDWEEWDQVFGKYVSVDIGEPPSSGEVWTPFQHQVH